MTPLLPDLGWLRKEAWDLSDEDKYHAIILLLDALEETQKELKEMEEQRNEAHDNLMRIRMGL